MTGPTGLVLRIPEAARLDRWRRRHDPSARQGMPPHVTLIYPFLDTSEIDDGVRARLTAIAAATAPFALSFLEIGRFAETVWMKPEPAAPVVRLIEALAAEFPTHPPYGGAFAAITPHLTVAQGPRHVLERVKAELRARLDAPIRTQVTAMELYGLQDGRWRLLEAIALSSPVAKTTGEGDHAQRGGGGETGLGA